MGWDQKKYGIYIGIDCGVKTGIAIWNKNKRCFDLIRTVKIHIAMDLVKEYKLKGMDIKARVEDASQVTFKTDLVKAQGAGSVKRDASIWRDYLTDMDIPFEMVRPNKKTSKLDVSIFQKITGYTGLTSSHSRDAAMIVFGL